MSTEQTKTPVRISMTDADVELILGALAAACEAFAGDKSSPFPVGQAADIGLKLSAAMILGVAPVFDGRELTLIAIVLNAAADTFKHKAADETLPAGLRADFAKGEAELRETLAKIEAPLDAAEEEHAKTCPDCAPDKQTVH